MAARLDQSQEGAHRSAVVVVEVVRDLDEPRVAEADDRARLAAREAADQALDGPLAASVRKFAVRA